MIDSWLDEERLDMDGPSLGNPNPAFQVYRHSLATPAALAVAMQDRSLGYAELAGRAAGMAAALREGPAWRLDQKRLPRVGIIASRSLDACIAVVGSSWAGATYVPIGLKQPEERTVQLLSMSGLASVICDEQGARLLTGTVLKACPPQVIAPGASGMRAPSNLQLIDTASLEPRATSEPAPIENSGAAYVLFTSGTTGIPKGVIVSAGSLRHFTGMIAKHLGLRACDRVLTTFELSFDAATHDMFSTWQAGASLHILPATRAMDAVKFARESRLTIWSSVPSLVGMLRQVKALAQRTLPDLRLAMFGGEPLTVGVVDAFRAAAPQCVIHNLYGPTEATIACLGSVVTRTTAPTPGRDTVPIGEPLPGCEAIIVDDAGSDAPAGAPGELAVSGVQLADGYLDDPAMTAARFRTRDGKRWYLTGDLALRDASGVFHCLGRLDAQVKILGHRIELEEVEAHLRATTGSDIVAAVPWPLADGAARGLVAFVGSTTLGPEHVFTVLSSLKARLPSYMVPARLLALPVLPVTPSGKVDRRALHRLLETEAV